MTAALGLTPERRASGRLALRYLARPETRQMFRDAGVTPQTPVIVVEWQTTMGEVRAMLRVQDASEKVAILIRRDQVFHFLLACRATPEGDYLRDADIDQASEVGMVYQTLTRKEWDMKDVVLPRRHVGAYDLKPILQAT